MKRNIWKSLGLALVGTPVTAFVGLIIVTLIGALDDLITKIQIAGYWWTMLIAAYILSFLYFIFEPKFRSNHERKKVVYTLTLYWEDKFIKENKPLPSGFGGETMTELLLERVKIWAWNDTELWSRYFPHEEYPKHLFNIVDNLELYLYESKKK